MLKLNYISGWDMFKLDSKILVVDDMKGIRLWLVKTLKAIGYQNITEATNGQEALDLVNQNSYDLIFLDIVMPVMTGIEFMKHLQKNDKLEKTPIIILSAETDGQLILDVVKLGVSQYIIKPATQAVIEKKMADVYKIVLEKSQAG